MKNSSAGLVLSFLKELSAVGTHDGVFHVLLQEVQGNSHRKEAKRK